MKKHLVISILVFVFLAGQAWGGTYYIDKRCQYDGNGSAAACAASAGAAGAFNSFLKPCNPTIVSASDNHTVNVVEGSGPYYPADANYLSQGFLYLAQNNAGFIITWNFNGNTFTTEIDLNSGSYEWHQSEAVGKTTWYYATAAGGANPSLTQPKSAIVNGDWNCESTNAVQVTPSASANNWAWGDYDTLGFSTVYVKYSGGNPTGSGISVLIPTKTRCIDWNYAGAGHYFYDGIFRGGNQYGASVNGPSKFVRCSFYNIDQNAVSLATAAPGYSHEFYHNKFIDAGHRAIAPYDINKVIGTVTVYNNYIEGTHMGFMILKDEASTWNIKNNVTHNLFAGAIQKLVATPTLNESNNVWHINGASTHGGRRISFVPSGASQWATTDSSSFPASFDTSTECVNLGDAGCGIDPRVDSNGRLQAGSHAIDAGTPVFTAAQWLANGDAAGNHYVFGAGPDIGAYERKKYLFDDDDVIPKKCNSTNAACYIQP